MARAHDGRWIADGPDGEARRRRYARKFRLATNVATGKPFNPPLDQGEAHLGLGDDIVRTLPGAQVYLIGDATTETIPGDAKPEVSVPLASPGTLTKCRECGNEFEAQRATAKFCSAKCRKRAAKKRAE